MSARKMVVAAMAVVLASSVMVVQTSSPVAAVVVDLVSADPHNRTPWVEPNPALVDDGNPNGDNTTRVNAIARIGNTIYIGGNFVQITDKNPDVTHNRTYIAAFNADTGKVIPTFHPVLTDPVDGTPFVYDIVPAADGLSLYIAGNFNAVNGTNRRKIARIDLAGNLITTFNVNGVDGVVRDAHLVGGSLYIGGTFNNIGFPAISRRGLARVNAATGAVDASFNMSMTGSHVPATTTRVVKFAITPDGSKLLAIGNFGTVQGATRDQIAMINLPTGTVSTWTTDFFNDSCLPNAFDTYMRDLDISPDGTFAVISTTGGYTAGSSCDTVSRFELGGTAAVSPTWIEYTGGDTTYAVEVAAGVAYVGGHFRWLNNASGVGAGAGAIPRSGIAALDTTNGLPLSWNPGRERGVGVFDFLLTEHGLWAGSDTERWGASEQHWRLALFPVPGVTVPDNKIGVLANDVYRIGDAGASDAVMRRLYDGVQAPAASVNVPNGGVAWNTSRGSFLVNTTLYTGFADNTMTARSFNGTTFGAPTTLALNDAGTPDSNFVAELDEITGTFFDPSSGRLYYTKTGQNSLFYRYFTPSTGYVGGALNPFTATGAIGALNPARVRGMFLSGGQIYFADSTSGDLLRIPFANGVVSGTPTVADATQDWQSRGLFVWTGTPAPGPNLPPIASFTTSCKGLTCTFDAAASHDSNGSIVAYAWTYGDGATGSVVKPTHKYTSVSTFSVKLTVTDNAGATASKTVTIKPTALVVAAGPARLLDTRNGALTVDGRFQGGGPKPAGSVLKLRVTGRATVPGTAAAVVLNVTAVNPTGGGYLTVFPCGSTQPNASSLNYAAGQVVANELIAKVGAGGKVCVFTSAGSELLADVVGYVPAGAPYVASTPARLLDTRNGATTVDHQFQGGGPKAAGSVVQLQITGRAGVPANAAAAVLNVTAVNPTGGGYLTVFPCGSTQPNASSLNYAAGQVVANELIAKLGGGKVCVFTSAGSELLADVVGYVPAGAPYVASTPARLLDTRNGATTVDHQFQGGGPKAAGSVLKLQVTGRAGVPANATAVVLNVTAVNPSGGGYLTVFPCGATQPNASSLNYAAGQVVANELIAKIGSGGKVCVFTSAGSELLADAVGFLT